ncbi:general substrate transporter [Kockiozyma suomiensis]|uniref:general substrate transporter n=1 Tax=Kockiozyma suomiensis TaxID=1337062 RepID=UPI003343A7DA
MAFRFHLPSRTRLSHRYISLVAACAMVLYGYDASVFNAVQGSDNWNNYYGNPNSSVVGSVTTAYTVGSIISGFFFSAPISDYFGRRFSIAVGAVIVIASTFVQAFSPRGSIGGFIAGRFFVGVGQGIALPAGPVYIGELAPADIRGTMMSFWQLFYSVGSFIAFWINYSCTKRAASLGDWDWRMVVIFQILVPILICGAIFFCPETPRWYAQKGRYDEARASLRRVRETDEEIDNEMAMITTAIEYEHEALKGSYWPLWKDHSLRRRLLLAFVINCGQQITGQGSLNNYSTIIYKKVFTDNDTIQLINALNGTFGILFTLNATWTVDRFGRKPVLFVGAIGMAICMIITATVETQTPYLPGNTKSQPVGIATVFLMFLFTLFYKPSWGAVVWIWTSEVFSMNVRAQAVGMSSQMQNVANAILQQVFPLILDKINFYTFYMFAGINFLLALFVWFVLPETKGVKLENMDTLFGGESHAERGADLILREKQGAEQIEYTEDRVSLTEEQRLATEKLAMQVVMESRRAKTDDVA